MRTVVRYLMHLLASVSVTLLAADKFSQHAFALCAQCSASRHFGTAKYRVIHKVIISVTELLVG